jgi:hypothetical protein
MATVQKRAADCKRHKRSIKARATELGMNNAGKGSEVDIVGVNGCSGVFIWADTLYGVYAVIGKFPKNVDELKKLVGSQASHITHVVISSPDDTDCYKPYQEGTSRPGPWGPGTSQVMDIGIFGYSWISKYPNIQGHHVMDIGIFGYW